MNFVQYASIVLTRREKDGVRAMDDEWRRFHKHVATAPFAGLALQDIQPKDIAAFIRSCTTKQADDARGARTLHPSTVKKIRQIVDNVFDHAVEEGLVQGNPVRDVRVRAKATLSVEVRDPLSLEEQKRIVVWGAPNHAKWLMMFAYGTGLRQSEQWHLRMRDLDLKNRTVTVRYGGEGLLPKNGKIRTIPLFGDGLTAAIRWLEERPSYDTDLVFPTVNGCLRQKGAPEQYHDWLAASGVRLRRWHDLRHTTAQSLIDGWWGKKWDIHDVCKFMGHSSVTVTETYYGGGLAALRAAAEGM